MKYEEVRKMVRRVMPSAVEELDENLDILKAKASKVVQDLAKNELSLDVREQDWDEGRAVESGCGEWALRSCGFICCVCADDRVGFCSF